MPQVSRQPGPTLEWFNFNYDQGILYSKLNPSIQWSLLRLFLDSPSFSLRMNGTDGEGLLVEKRTVENEIYWDLGRFSQSQLIYMNILRTKYIETCVDFDNPKKMKVRAAISWQLKCSMFFQGDRLHSGLGLLLPSHGNRQQAPWPSTPNLSFFSVGGEVCSTAICGQGSLEPSLRQVIMLATKIH